MSRDDATIRIVFDGEERSKPPTAPIVRAATVRQQFVTGARRRAMRIGRGAAQTAVGGGILGEAFGVLATAAMSPVAVATFAALAVTRLATGKPLAGTGEELNQMIFGDEDDKARAKRHTREYLESHEDVMLAVGRRGSVPDDIANIGLNYYQRELTKERGLSKLRQAFPVNGAIDMIAERAAEAAKGAWNSILKPAIDRFVRGMQEAESAFGSAR
jgi:hypothetical protein